MPEIDPIVLLISSGAITRERVERAALLGIPIVPRSLVDSAERVVLADAITQQLRELAACPVRRDANGTVHVLLADPDAKPAVTELLAATGACQACLAPEAEVRALLQRLYPSAPSPAPLQSPAHTVPWSAQALAQAGDGAAPASAPAPVVAAAAPADPLAPRASGSFLNPRRDRDDETLRIPQAPRPPASADVPLAPIDIDLEASSRMTAAPAAPSPAPAAPAVLPTEPFAPRASGSFRKKRPLDDEETQRVPRAPRPAADTALASPAKTPVLDELTLEDAAQGPALMNAAMKAAKRRAFIAGVIVGAFFGAVIFALVSGLLHAGAP